MLQPVLKLIENRITIYTYYLNALEIVDPFNKQKRTN